MNLILKMCGVMVLCNFSLNAMRPRIYFNGSIKGVLKQLISNEQECIKFAMYAFTDQEIADKLIAAHGRGVRIEAIVDSLAANNPNGIVNILRAHDIPVKEREKLAFCSAMHLKCWMFKSTKLDNRLNYGPCVLTGSCNCTYNGAYRNDEMMVLLRGKKFLNECNENFKYLKSQSIYIPKEGIYTPNDK